MLLSNKQILKKTDLNNNAKSVITKDSSLIRGVFFLILNANQAKTILNELQKSINSR
jgi:hypothetical protein